MTTPMTDGEYVRNAGLCPFCRSSQISGGSFEIDCNYVTQEIDCDDCGKSWWDIYELKGYEEIPERSQP